MTEPTANFVLKSSVTQFKVPTELIRKNFKALQKLLQKQQKHIALEVHEIRENPHLSPTAKLDMIRKLITSLEHYKNRLGALQRKDNDYRERISARFDVISEISNFTVDRSRNSTKEGCASDTISENSKRGAFSAEDITLDLHNVNFINWYREQANLLIIDFLIKSNKCKEHNVGIKLLENISINNKRVMKLIDYDLYEDLNKVFVSILEGHNLDHIKNWFNDNKNLLRKNSSNLEFEIKYCEFLSLIESGNIDIAIQFSQSELSKYGNKRFYSDSERPNYEENLKRLRVIGGLLVYLAMQKRSEKNSLLHVLSFSDCLSNSSKFLAYENLLSHKRWNDLATCFVDNFTNLYGISKEYPLFIYLSAGLTSLKTKSCYYNTKNTAFKLNKESIVEDLNYTNHQITVNRKYRGPNYYYNILHKINNCPVCSPELFQISRNLPYAQLITSIFTNPFKLPNGNIYPFDKLLSTDEDFTSERNSLLRMGKVKDPLTKEIFMIDDCSRVYAA